MNCFCAGQCPLGLLIGIVFWVIFGWPLFAQTDSGRADRIPWSGSYWPMQNDALIAGPLSKYDAITGRHAAELERSINPPNVAHPIWLGYCHGWAAASVIDAEPRTPLIATAANGRKIALSVGDQKGMLTASHTNDQAQQFGMRFDGNPTDDEHDIGPDRLWEILRLYLGEHKVPIILDIDPTEDVWNYPVWQYRVDYQRNAAQSDLYKAKMSLWMADDDVEADFVGTKHAGLQLDFTFKTHNGAILMGSGKWVGESVHTHPDFAWYPTSIMAENPQISHDLVLKIIGDHTAHAAELLSAAKPLNDSDLAATSTLPPSVSAMNRLTAPRAASSTDSAVGFSPESLLVSTSTDPLATEGSIKVSLVVDHATGLYYAGETVGVRIRSERSGYLYLFYTDAAQNHLCLFPNDHQQDNRINANQTVRVPAFDAEFQLRVGAPFGIERLEAIVSTQPLPSLDSMDFSKASATPISRETLKGVYVEAKELGGGTPASTPTSTSVLPTTVDGDEVASASAGFQWGNASLNITTRPSADGQLPTAGLFVGVSRFADPDIRSLETPGRDAMEFAKAMKEVGGLKHAIILLDDEATLQGVTRAISEKLLRATKAGDSILIYWSGHGGQMQVPEVEGGFSEYLIPYDGKLDTQAGMLTDREFGKLVAQLPGRQVIVILDACHSGGQSDHPKAIPVRQIASQHLAGIGPGFERQLVDRTKSLGGRGTALLASSQASQLSFERRAGDLSVMTYFLIERMMNTKDWLTLTDAAAYVCEQVPKFVEHSFPGNTQTPLFVDRTTRTILIRP